MGTTLTGKTIASSYSGLIKTTDNGTLNGSAKVLTDGVGTNTALKLSTTQLLFGQGSETAPALSFDGNTTEGIFLPNDEELGFTLGGTERMRLTSTTLSLLTCDFSIITDKKIYLGSSNESEIYHTASSFRIKTDNSSNLRIDSGSNIQLRTANNDVSASNENILGYHNNNNWFTISGADPTPVGSGAGQTGYDLHISNIAVDKDIIFQGNDNGTLVTAMTLDMSEGGKVRFNAYGSGTVSGTEAYRLGVDSSGNVIEITDGGGTITGSGTIGTIPKFTGTSALGDSPITISSDNSTFGGKITINSASSDGLTISNPSATNDYLLIGHDDTLNSLYTSRAENSFGTHTFRQWDGSTTRNILTLDASQNATFEGTVGINMTAGTVSTEIKGRSSDGKSLRLWDNGGTDILDLYNDGTNAYINTTHSGGAGNPLIIQTNSLTALTLDTSQNATFEGNVIIPTTKELIIGSQSAAEIPLGITIRDDQGDAPVGMVIHNENTGTSADAQIAFETQGALDFSIGIDRSDSNKFVMSRHGSLGTNNVFTIDGTAATFAGQVGIGTTPTAKLDIDGAMNGASVRIIGDQPVGTYYYGYMYDGTNLKGTTQTNIFYSGGSIAASTTITDFASIRIDAPSTAASGAVITNNYGIYQSSTAQKNYFAGNIGIGTTVPAFPLEVENSSTAYIFSETTGASASSGYRWKTPDSEFAWFSTGGTNAMALYDYVAGAERMRITSDGKIQAQTSGGYYLTESTTNAFSITSNGANGYFAITDEYNSGERIRITSTGNVGIGTTAPDSKLNIEGTKTVALSNAADFLTLGLTVDDNNAFDTAGLGGGIAFRGKRNVGGVQTVYGAIDVLKESTAGDSYTGSMRFYTNQNSTGVPLERMKITSAGKVGINTTAPDTDLQVITAGSSDQDGVLKIGGSAASLGLVIDYDQANSTVAKITSNPTYTSTTALMKLCVDGDANANQLVLKGDGNVGIGTTDPQANLEISDTDAAGLTIRSVSLTGYSLINFADAGDENVGRIYYGHDDNAMRFRTNDAERIRITSDGTLLIGCTSEGNTNAYFSLESNDRSVLALGTSTTSTSTVAVFRNPNGGVGSVSVSGSATAFNTSSDYRLKEDLQDFNALEIASKIKMYDFKWKSDESRSYGVMAHELEEVLPQAVTGEKDAEEMQQVDYSKLVPILLKSIQELKAEVDELKKNK